MQPFSSVARPGAIVTQLFPSADQRDGGTVRALRAIAGEGFFEAVMVAPVQDVRERRDVAALLADEGLTLTYALIPPMIEQGLSLSAADADLRQRSVDAVLGMLDGAKEAGARRVMVGSGPAPADEGARRDALGRLADSFRVLCRAATEAGMVVVIEPLDVSVHKKQTLGFTSEAVALVEAMDADRAGIALCLDTAHMTLNGEDVVAGIGAAGPMADTLHFCNCVTDPGHPLYGDHHPPLGAPGHLDVPEMGRILADAVRLGFLGPDRRIEVVVEEFNHGDEASGLQVMRAGRAALEGAWELAQASVG